MEPGQMTSASTSHIKHLWLFTRQATESLMLYWRTARRPKHSSVDQCVSSVAKVMKHALFKNFDCLSRLRLPWLCRLVLAFVWQSSLVIGLQKMAHTHLANGRWYLTSSARVDELLQAFG